MRSVALAINCGSSSLKYALFEATPDGERMVDRHDVDDIEDHANAVRSVLRKLTNDNLRPSVVGHRVVHGGPNLTKPTRIDDEVLRAFDALVPFARLHLPAEITAIREVATQWPDVPQVACFDTAFHHSMPEVARRYPLPSSVLGAGVRRYGFHGLSYEYVAGALGQDLRPRTIIAHLGSGASMVAVKDGKSIDTTMGFTPTGGLVMSTRPGDLDPGLLLYLAREGMGIGALERIVQHESGMVALSETSGDMRKLLTLRESDTRAALAIESFCMSARKAIGAFAAVLGGIDALVFTGGIGENAPPIRAEVVRGLSHLGIEIDSARNARNEEGIISLGSCEVRMMRTDEERIVARHAFAALGIRTSHRPKTRGAASGVDASSRGSRTS